MSNEQTRQEWTALHQRFDLAYRKVEEEGGSCSAWDGTVLSTAAMAIPGGAAGSLLCTTGSGQEISEQARELGLALHQIEDFERSLVADE